ncbi:MAG: response regulator, partial [Candidatus Rokuibacteriota bacterium]
PGRVTDHEHSILVVDDQTDSSDAVGLLLEEQGFKVRIARDGEEALDALHRGLRPCLVVVDLMMPKMDGWEFRQRQLSDPQFATIPVVMMSGYPNAQEAAGTLGVRTVLKKPLSVNRLLSLVHRHCPLHAGAASTA